MKGAVYLLSRRVKGRSGEELSQNVTVFAESESEARDLVLAEFARLRRIGVRDRAYSATPAFTVEEVTLEQPKVITNAVTT